MRKSRTLFKWIHSYWIVILFSILCLIFGIYNFSHNKDFLKAPLTTIITILVAVIVSFYLVQRKTDSRRKSEKIDKLLYKVQEMINDPVLITFSPNTLLLHRSVINTIKLIETNIAPEFKQDIANIKEKFEYIRNVYGNHYTDEDFMQKSYVDLINYVYLIDDICNKIHMELE